jgi:DNA-binding NarL/FixJ family response regulator
MSRTTIVLADDHTVVRQGLRAVLEAEPGFSVIGEVDNGLDVAKTMERLKPDVLIVDLMMPGLGGLEVTRQIPQCSPQTRVIVLSMYANEAYVLEALRNGASGYVVKDASAEDLRHAIREVVAGRRYLSPPLSELAIEAYVQKAKAAPLDPYETLTTREREVLHLAAEGHTNTEIAARLFISPRTVETHRAHLMRKLDLHSQTDLIRYALRRGILPPEA